MNLAVIQQFLDAHDYQLKFVVDVQQDFTEISEILSQLKNVEPARVLIMAQGTTNQVVSRKAKWIVEACKLHGFSYTPRLQLQLFGNRRGT